MFHRLEHLLERMKSDSRLEWLVVATVLVPLVLALALGWIDLDLPTPF